MSTKFIDKCPACGADMYLSTFKCSNCGIEIKGDFEMPNNNSSFNLSQDEFDFSKVFLKHEGKICYLNYMNQNLSVLLLRIVI